MSPSGNGPAAGGPAGDVRIDRLALRVAGLDEDAAHALARLVAVCLTPGMLRSAGLAGLDCLRVKVEASTAEQSRPDLLARHIAAEVGRALIGHRVSAGHDGEAV